MRHCIWRDGLSKLKPGHFISVASHRRFPQRRHFQLRQSAFHTIHKTWRFNLNDKGGDATCECGETHILTWLVQAHSLQTRQQSCMLGGQFFDGWCERRCVQNKGLIWTVTNGCEISSATDAIQTTDRPKGIAHLQRKKVSFPLACDRQIASTKRQ